MTELYGVKIGDSHEMTRRVSEEDIQDFARVSGDDQPLHLDPDFAGKTRFKGRIAHGMLSAGYISAVIGTQLFPRGVAIYLSQQLRFLRPVKVGDTVTTRAEVKEIDAERRIVTLQTDCFNQDEKPVVTGEAAVMLDEVS
ncbi:MAG: (R)-hydratase [Dehalococcoidia bacterium]|nr:(R)-hydratase [Dehalococcoidia bacterium]